MVKEGKKFKDIESNAEGKEKENVELSGLEEFIEIGDGKIIDKESEEKLFEIEDEIEIEEDNFVPSMIVGGSAPVMAQMAVAPQGMDLEHSVADVVVDKRDEEEQKVLYSSGSKISDADYLKVDNVADYGVGINVQAESSDFSNIGRGREKLGGVNFENPEGGRMSSKNKLEQEYISTSNVDIEKVGRDNPTAVKEYKVK